MLGYSRDIALLILRFIELLSHDSKVDLTLNGVFFFLGGDEKFTFSLCS